MSKDLMISISGVRGVVGKGLTPDIISGFAMAFGTFVKGGTLVIGSDTRPSREMVKHAVISGLLGTGCTVIDLGICPTPTVLFNVKKLRTDGGIAITASHNPEKWNAMKFIGSNGSFLNRSQANKLIATYIGNKARPVPWNMQGKLIRDDAAIQRHIEGILRLPYVHQKKLQRRRFRVGIDCVNGGGYEAFPGLLRALGCEVIPVFCEETGDFERDPEPVARNLGALSRTVKRKRLDIGFATDADGDRLSIVDNTAKPLGEEYSLPFAIDFMLGKKKGNVVCNLSTSRLTDFVTKKHGCKLYKARVGEAHVVKKMRSVHAVIGGEGNGGIILPGLHHTRDALLGMALILQYMLESKKSIGQQKAGFPVYRIVKKKKRIKGKGNLHHDAIAKKLPRGRMNKLDGLRIDWKDSWIHVRKSGTEPIVRVIAEAKTKRKAEQLCKKAMELIR
jgi:phosphomannomutase